MSGKSFETLTFKIVRKCVDLMLKITTQICLNTVHFINIISRTTSYQEMVPLCQFDPRLIFCVKKHTKYYAFHENNHINISKYTVLFTILKYEALCQLQWCTTIVFMPLCQLHWIPYVNYIGTCGHGHFYL